MGCAGEARARTGTPIAVPSDFRSDAGPPTQECSTSERRLCRRNDAWGEVSEGGRSPPPSGTYREYASRAAVGRRLAAGPFSSLSLDFFAHAAEPGRARAARGMRESRGVTRPGD